MITPTLGTAPHDLVPIAVSMPATPKIARARIPDPELAAPGAALHEPSGTDKVTFSMIEQLRLKANPLSLAG